MVGTNVDFAVSFLGNRSRDRYTQNVACDDDGSIVYVIITCQASPTVARFAGVVIPDSAEYGTATVAGQDFPLLLT